MEPLKDPWNVEITQRLKKIHSNSSKKKVVYIYERPDSSTFRYRVYNMCQALENSESWLGTYFFEDELKILENSLSQIHLLIFVRTCWSLTLDAFFHRAKKYKIPTIFDVDDLVINVEKIPQIMNALGVAFSEKDYCYWFSYVSRLWMMGQMCDSITSTNEALCHSLHETFKKPCFILNNFLNHEQINISQKIYEKKSSEQERKSPFTLGYFSGSPSHRNDFKRIAEELRAILNLYPEICLEVVGYMEIPAILQELYQKNRILMSPFVDFRILQEKISQVHVNLVPLLDNEFSNCKSELKFFEAAIVGTITCATPSHSYRKSIRTVETGFLCEEGQWLPSIEKIFRQDYSRTMVSQAREYCLKKYSPSAQAHSMEEVFSKIY